MNHSPTTRYSLLARLHDLQDEQAWIEFTAIYEPLVRRLARQRGLKNADAADLSQEVFHGLAVAMERQLFDRSCRPSQERQLVGFVRRCVRRGQLNLLHIPVDETEGSTVGGSKCSGVADRSRLRRCGRALRSMKPKHDISGIGAAEFVSEK